MKNKKDKKISNSPIPVDSHIEYIRYHDSFDQKDIEWAKDNRDKLLRKKISIEEKKRILFGLAHGEDLKSLYGIQKYLKNSDTELESFATLAWQECQGNVLNTGMEKSMGDAFEPEPTIMGGVVRNNQKLWLCFALSSKKPLTQVQKEKIEKVVLEKGKNFNADIEEVKFGKNYVRIILSLPIDVIIEEYIVAVGDECNTPKPFLRQSYFAVNTHVLSEEEILDYIKELEI